MMVVSMFAVLPMIAQTTDDAARHEAQMKKLKKGLNEKSVKAAILRVVSLATPEEISGCDIYVAGEDVIDSEIITAVKSLGVETIIAIK